MSGATERRWIVVRARILGRVRKPWNPGRAVNRTWQQRSYIQGMSNRQRQAWAKQGYSLAFVDRAIEAEERILRAWAARHE